VRAVTDWTVRDGNGDLLLQVMAGSRQEVARKLARNRYDPFRLQVSSSYREVFDRDVKSVLEFKDWQIVPVSRRTRAHRRGRQLELKLNWRPRTPLAKAGSCTRLAPSSLQPNQAR
jgi:hypothetical protein